MPHACSSQGSTKVRRFEVPVFKPKMQRASFAYWPGGGGLLDSYYKACEAWCCKRLKALSSGLLHRWLLEQLEARRDGNELRVWRLP